jgi:hypothetical protein
MPNSGRASVRAPARPVTPKAIFGAADNGNPAVGLLPRALNMASLVSRPKGVSMTQHLSHCDRRIERSIVLQLLRDDHDERWSRAELEKEVNAEPAVLSGALARLERHGVVVALDDCVLASRCARHIDALELIGI